MPTYLYRCPHCATVQEVIHEVGHLASPPCEWCNSVMRKIPQQFAVNWHGNKPSDGGITPYVRQMIADAPRQRDEFQARKELE